jgi:hypothetical protein
MAIPQPKKRFNIKKWLESETTYDVPTHERFCYLIVANNGFDGVNSGNVTELNGHQLGLTINEAKELIYIQGVVKGLELTGINFHAAFQPYYDRYLKKHKLDQIHAENLMNEDQNKDEPTCTNAQTDTNA